MARVRGSVGAARAGASFSYIARFNERTVIQALRVLGPASQAEIAEHTALSVQAVSVIVRNLMGRGLVRELRTESVGRGRPRTILEVVASARQAVGIHLDPGSLTVATVDLNGQVMEADRSRGVFPEDPERTLAEVVRMVGAVRERHRFVGVCMAVPGPLTDHGAAIVDTLWLPGWKGFPLRSRLAELLGMNVPVVKDTVAAVIGENWVRPRQTHDAVMLYVYLGTGIGLGVSAFGDPIAGYSGNAGEVGQLLDVIGAADQLGASAVANDPLILLHSAHELGVLTGPAPRMPDLDRVDQGLASLAGLGRGGDPAALRILGSAGERMGRLVAVAAELFDANLVVFGGPYWIHLYDFYKPAARAALARRTAAAPHMVEVVSTALGSEVGAIGAAAVVLDDRYVPRAPRVP